VVLFRTSATGRSRMPYIGTRLVDPEGIALLREWIEQVPHTGNHPSDLDSLRSAITTPDADLERIAVQEASSTSGALRLAHAANHPSISIATREKLGRAVMKLTNPLVHELFDRFLPANDRMIVSQSTAPKAEILALNGDAHRGSALLANTSRLTCLQCHQYQTAGRNFGPDFKKTLQNKTKTEVLDQILEPSRQIAPEFVLYTAELDDDEFSGIIVRRDEKEIVLRDANAIDHVVDAAKIKSLRAQQLSAMPEGLLAGLTAQEVADLLAALLSEAAR